MRYEASVTENIEDICNVAFKRHFSYQELKNEFEKAALEILLQKHKYNQSKTALAMGLSRGNFREKLKKHFGNKYFQQLGD